MKKKRKKRQNFNICNLSMGGIDTYKTKLVKIFKAKM